MIKGKNGTLLTENEKIADEFKKMFNSLLNQPSKRTNIEERVSIEQKTESPSIVEVDYGLEMLKYILYNI